MIDVKHVSALGLAGTLLALIPAPAVGAEASLTSVGSQGAATLKEAQFEISVAFEGVVAQVSARQTIVNAGPVAAEALYTFDVPVDAAVTGVNIRMPDGRSSAAMVVDAEAALTPLPDPDAVAAAPDLGVLRLVARDVPGIDGDTSLSTATYELRVYPVPAQQAVTVTIDWIAPLRYDDGRLLLRIPGRGNAAGLVREQVSLRLTPPAGVRGFGAVHGGGRALGRGVRQARFPAAPRGDVVIDAALDFGALGAEARPLVSMARIPIDSGMGAIGLSVLAPLGAGARALAYERVLLVLDVSRSLDRPGLAATTTVIDALLGNMPANTRVEAVLFDRSARRLFERFRANDAEARKALAQALRPDELANGSDLGAALETARAILRKESLDAQPAEGFERGARAATLMVVVSDGMIPLELTPRRALDRLGGELLQDVAVASVILVPDEAPVPDTREGVLATLARKSSGRVMAVRFAEAQARASALAAALVRPVLLNEVELDAGGVVLSGIDLPSTIEPGHGVIAVGLYRGAGPAGVSVTGLAQGQPVRLAAQRDTALGRAALPLALVRAQPESFLADLPATAREPDVAAVAAAQRRLVASARKAGAVTRYTSLVALDASDRFARDRATMTRTWGASAFFRLPPPPERPGGHTFRRFERRVPPDRHAADTPSRRTGQLDREIVERLLERHVKPMAKRCYEDALRREPGLAGTMTVVLELGRGEVQHADVLGSTLQHAGVEACVARAAYGIQVPRVALGDDPEIISVVRYPLELRKRQRSGEVRFRSEDEEPALRELLNSSDPLDGLDERR
jgi:hypothetical protein